MNIGCESIDISLARSIRNVSYKAMLVFCFWR